MFWKSIFFFASLFSLCHGFLPQAGSLENGICYYTAKTRGDYVIMRLVVKGGYGIEGEARRGYLALALRTAMSEVDNSSFGISSWLKEKWQQMEIAPILPQLEIDIEALVIQVVFPAKDKYSIKKGLEYFARLINFRNFQDAILQEEKRKLFEDLKNDDGYVPKAEAHFLKEIFGIGDFIEQQGIEECLKTADTHSLADFYTECFCSENLAVVVTGDFDEAETISEIKKVFSPFEKRVHTSFQNKESVVQKQVSIYVDGRDKGSFDFLWLKKDAKKVLGMRDQVCDFILAKFFEMRVKEAEGGALFFENIDLRLQEINDVVLEGFSFDCRPGMTLEGIQLVKRELDYLNFISVKEFENIKREVKVNLKTLLSMFDNYGEFIYAEEFTRIFVKGELFTDIQEQFEKSLLELDTISYETFFSYLSTFLKGYMGILNIALPKEEYESGKKEFESLVLQFKSKSCSSNRKKLKETAPFLRLPFDKAGSGPMSKRGKVKFGHF